MTRSGLREDGGLGVRTGLLRLKECARCPPFRRNLFLSQLLLWLIEMVDIPFYTHEHRSCFPFDGTKNP
jgi:hypothetical protein